MGWGIHREGLGKLSEEVALGPGLKRKALVLRVLAGTRKRTRRAHRCGLSVPAHPWDLLAGGENTPNVETSLWPLCKRDRTGGCGPQPVAKPEWGPVPQAGGPSSNPFRRRKSPS